MTPMQRERLNDYMRHLDQRERIAKTALLIIGVIGILLLYTL